MKTELKEKFQAMIDQATKEALKAIEGSQDGYPCGFAWVRIKSGRGNFAKWLIETDIGSKNYNGGMRISAHCDYQNMYVREAYCTAFRDVLREHGIECHVETRID